MVGWVRADEEGMVAELAESRRSPPHLHYVHYLTIRTMLHYVHYTH